MILHIVHTHLVISLCCFPICYTLRSKIIPRVGFKVYRGSGLGAGLPVHSHGVKSAEKTFGPCEVPRLSQNKGEALGDPRDA